MDARTFAMVGVLAAQSVVALPAWAEPRPQVSALRLSERDVLLRFTRQVQADPELRRRAMALWDTHFAAQADELKRRFTTQEDWRPVLADAAALIDEFLEASLLPREGETRADGQAGKVWVETLDPRTGQRVRQLRDAAKRPRLLAPTGGDEAKPGQPKQPQPKGLRDQQAPKSMK
jgi:hypothetical protein